MSSSERSDVGMLSVTVRVHLLADGAALRGRNGAARLLGAALVRGPCNRIHLETAKPTDGR
ncbi:MAG TPA: hypothetical protein VNO21_06235 [Polyangiaceae bacterium]|nr:hypothetical protein [Polyangiaceae bacterium]